MDSADPSVDRTKLENFFKSVQYFEAAQEESNEETSDSEVSETVA